MLRINWASQLYMYSTCYIRSYSMCGQALNHYNNMDHCTSQALTIITQNTFYDYTSNIFACFRLMSKMSSNVPIYLNSLILYGVKPTKKEIGRGAYGRVFEVNYEGTFCAAKEVHTILLQYAQGSNLQKIKDDFLNECQICSTLRHPCIVQFLGSVILVVYNDCY